MESDYNLLDEPWIPVRLRSGEQREIGLSELFGTLGDISTLAETSPPSQIALHRLLLTIVHRALANAQGHWKDRERAAWYRDGLPQTALQDYLEQWLDRFWLFHPDHPFMQVPVLAELTETRDVLKPWTQISLDAVNGNAPVVFDHSLDREPHAISPAKAVRNLLGYLQFIPGGLVRVIRGSDNAGALANTAAALPLGQTLNQTLCLALHPSSRVSATDLPSWEMRPPDLAALKAPGRLATGPCDRYTRLSRAVLLLREENERMVRWVRFAAGLALAEDANAPDPMASYRIGTNGPVRLSFSEGRAIWRDLPSFLPNAAGESAIPAPVLNSATALLNVLGFWDAEMPILVAGLASNQAKLLRWRAEHFRLPAALLIDPDAGGLLRQQIKTADDFYFRLRGIATELVAGSMPDSDNKDTRKRARAVLDAGPCAGAYFAMAERALPFLMHEISAGRVEEAVSHWHTTLAAAAQAAWDAVFRSLGHSSAAIRAEARTHHKLYHLVREIRGDAPTRTNLAADRRVTTTGEVHP